MFLFLLTLSFPLENQPTTNILKKANMREITEIKNLLLATKSKYIGKNVNFWKNPPLAYGYHSINISNIQLTGQRNPFERLNILRKFINFRNKTVVDLGCNVGGMLHHLFEMKQGFGFEYDERCVRAATRISEIFELPEKFYHADLNKFDVYRTFANIDKKPDIVFMFNIGSWVVNWTSLYTKIVEFGVRIIVLETNNDKEGKAQLDLFTKLGKTIVFLSKARDDITKNFLRKTYLIY